MVCSDVACAILERTYTVDQLYVIEDDKVFEAGDFFKLMIFHVVVTTCEAIFVVAHYRCLFCTNHIAVVC